MAETIRYARAHSSLGGFIAAMSRRGLVIEEFSDPDDELANTLRNRFPDAEVIEDPAFMGETLERLGALIDHPEVKSDLPIDLRGSAFEVSVWNALREIPAGEIVNYGEIAARIGAPGEA